MPILIHNVDSVIQKLQSGEIRILFVSPEKFIMNSLHEILRNSPPVWLVCIDEAHCLSEWSHNFRPSYLQIPQICKKISTLRHRDGDQRGSSLCLFAITATATRSVWQNIATILEIEEENIIIRPPYRKNIRLSVSEEKNKLKGVVQYFKMDEKQITKPSIVYCSYQRDVESVTSYLQGCGFDAVAYHGGMATGVLN
jgi:superfamily II DNA helicase RecQ